MSLLSWLLLLSTLIPLHVYADSSATVAEPLLPWVDWVLQETPKYKCPFFYNKYQQQYCAWPSQLELELEHKQGHFKGNWQVYANSYLSLPGDKLHWPQDVRVDDKATAVLTRNNKPAIKLSAGYYTIQGHFFWDTLPDSLAIPKRSALISVRVLDERIPNPAIKNSQLWLKASDTGQTKPKGTLNQLNLQVFRKITDTIPLQVSTLLSLEVSGNQREIKLPYALLNDFIPISLDSSLPAKLETDGSLLIQVSPGRWQIKLHARHPEHLTDLGLAISNSRWPASEIWSFEAQTYQRVVEIEQVTAIDPSQNNVPREWQKLPAFMLKQGDTMHFNVIQRGDPDPEPNNLSITRNLWLDFAGTGYTAQDLINGKMTHDWRLDSIPETLLGHATLNDQTLLITESLNNKSQGIELRKGHIALMVESRIENDINSLSATGWQQKFNKVNTILHLPPGWHLLAVTGVDNVPSSWIARWTLLDLFLVLIAALAVSRLWNNYWGLGALITLALIWHEALAPHFIWLNILATISLIKVLPDGKFLRLMQFYRSTSFLILLLICIPFLIHQVRTGLYPQLEQPWQDTNSSYGYALLSTQTDSVSSIQEESDQEALGEIKSLRKIMRSPAPASSDYPGSAPKFKRIDPNANLQTGPGLPQWQWTNIKLSWNGSVDSQQQIRLWYLNPTASLILNSLRVIIVTILSLLMLGIINKRFKFKIPSLAAHLCLLTFLIIPMTSAHAEYPSPELLDELKQRLLKAPDCLPACAQISSMQLDINNESLDLTLQVHTQEKVAIPLPAKYEQWLPSRIVVNNSAAKAIIRDKHGLLWISLNKGIHTVTLTGKAPPKASFTLPLPLKPHYITQMSRHWAIDGLKKDGTTENQLHFTRLSSNAQTINELPVISQGILPAFIRVERTLHLGLDWYITTRVHRVTKHATAVTLKVPLLKGESISSANIRSQNGYALVHMTANQQTLKWKSLLEKNNQLTLQAPETDQWTEVWRADISPIWHIQSTGIAAIHHQDQSGNWLPTWQPWSEETVTLTITRPKAVAGQTLTIDKSVLQITSGKRSQVTRLELDLRSSKGTQHSLTLPENAQLESVLINGTTQPIRQQQLKVTLPIRPGKQHFELNWHEAIQQPNILTTPALNLGIASVNSHLKVRLGHDRWVLLTIGPQLGPAVLFWGVLIVLAALAFALGKSSITPLTHWQWFLLFIGLSQIPVSIALIVVAWLMALGIRKQQASDNANTFNLFQIALVLLTLSSLVILFIAVKHGLLSSPEMQIIGNHSTAYQLNWYQDRNFASLNKATVISIPLAGYRILMLLWSLWLAISLLNWLKWGWQCFSYQGLWKKSVPKNTADETP